MLELAITSVPLNIIVSKLSKAHDIKVITASEIANTVISIVPGNRFIEFVFGYHRHKMSKTVFP